MKEPELSIVIPTLNEAAALPLLLADLGAQAGIACEVVVSDGGSSDGTPEIAAAALARHRLPGRVVRGPSGRGRQLNRGATQAAAQWLLFLHADSRLPEPAALAGSLARLRAAGDPRLAGRFTLRFDLPQGERDFGCYLCEVKARSGLPATIHGDQGFWLTRAFFIELGGFREDLPVLEDTLLAEAVRERGRWERLPAEIVTSPRRFRSEGYRARQTINALLVNFAMIGWDAPLHRMPVLYRVQERTRPLDPAACCREIRQLLDELPCRERMDIWLRTGAFVRGNVWQLALQRAARRAFAAGRPAGEVSLDAVSTFRHRFDRLTDHPPGRLAAALLTRLWFAARTGTSLCRHV